MSRNRIYRSIMGSKYWSHSGQKAHWSLNFSGKTVSIAGKPYLGHSQRATTTRRVNYGGPKRATATRRVNCGFRKKFKAIHLWEIWPSCACILVLSPFWWLNVPGWSLDFEILFSRSVSGAMTTSAADSVTWAMFSRGDWLWLLRVCAIDELTITVHRPDGGNPCIFVRSARRREGEKETHTHTAGQTSSPH